MDPTTTAKLATTACKHRKDGQKFLTAVLETNQGIDVSVDSQELAGHVDEHFDGHTEGGKAIVEGFKRVSYVVTAAAAVGCCCWLLVVVVVSDYTHPVQ